MGDFLEAYYGGDDDMSFTPVSAHTPQNQEQASRAGSPRSSSSRRTSFALQNEGMEFQVHKIEWNDTAVVDNSRDGLSKNLPPTYSRKEGQAISSPVSHSSSSQKFRVPKSTSFDHNNSSQVKSPNSLGAIRPATVNRSLLSLPPHLSQQLTQVHSSESGRQIRSAQQSPRAPVKSMAPEENNSRSYSRNMSSNMQGASPVMPQRSKSKQGHKSNELDVLVIENEEIQQYYLESVNVQ
eukprot:CAMPEP_0184703102 /NCGR_PEP_ID=MMETSP0313-20130426/26608_1 /TAXON_ID=2792 /ORGANISM="Porphyridium aerugineum, Strain SAG 1380-2" /LENGTH=237 /DNA_ID=CAMNT_0027163785 /DNA_START=163 /DNA_END=876 /DNA_ORIENTATION=-